MSKGNGYEYRVRWQREGKRAASQIYQTKMGARSKKIRLEVVDELKNNDTPGSVAYGLHELPDLVGPPTIERRRVLDWREAKG